MNIIESYGIIFDMDNLYELNRRYRLDELFRIANIYGSNPRFFDMIKDYCKANLYMINDEREFNPFMSLVTRSTTYQAKLVQILIDCGANINRLVYGRQYPILYYTLIIDDLKYAKLLLENGAKTNNKYDYGYNALYHAIYHNRQNAIEMVLEYDAKPNCNSINSCTSKPFYESAVKNISLLNTKN